MSVPSTDLTAERVRELLDYDPVTGALDWKNPSDRSPREAGKAGALARAGSKYQYRRFIQIDYKRYPAHRLAWLHHHGAWPSQYLLPKNDDYDDLRIANFAETSRSEAARRGGPNRANSSGFRGVTWDKSKERWLAYITHQYKRIHVGYFGTKEEAIAARDQAATNLDSLPILDKAKRDEKFAAATRDARLRVLWRKVQRQTAGITNWPSFDVFAQDLGDLPPAHGRRLILIPIRAEETIGPGNYQWHEQTSSWAYGTAEGKLRYARAHREQNRNSYRHRELLKNFGIGFPDYERMRKEQEGVCAICSEAETRTRYGKPTVLAVDHCHSTGAIRGLLCNNCNNGIGRFRDDPDLLRKAAAYLERYATLNPVGAASPPRLKEDRNAHHDPST